MLGSVFGTPAHEQLVFSLCRSHACFSSKGSRVKIGRWASWFNANREWASKRSVFLLVLLYMGVSKGWWHGGAELFVHHASFAVRGALAEDTVVAPLSGEPRAAEAVAAPSASAGASSSSGLAIAVPAPRRGARGAATRWRPLLRGPPLRRPEPPLLGPATRREPQAPPQRSR